MSVLEVEDREGGVRLVILNRPKVNALDMELLTAISEVFREAGNRPEVRALVMTGKGTSFSGGLDFNAMMKATMGGPDSANHYSQVVRQTFMDIWTCPRPTVSAVNGSAIAGGYLIAVGCDFRFVAEVPGEYGLNEVAWGAGFPPIAVEIGRYVMGRHLPLEILGAELFDWRRGCRNGTFTHSVPESESLVDVALKQARLVAQYPQAAYAHLKAQLLEPYVQRVLDEPEEHKKKTAEIFTTNETVVALMKYASSVLNR